MLNFRTFLEQNTVGPHNNGFGGSFLSSDQTGSEQNPSNFEGRPLNLPGLDLGLPTVTKTGIVTFIEKKTNPIKIFLSDGTKLFFSLDEYKRIKGNEPDTGKTMSVTFQRNVFDKSGEMSQIQNIRCY